MPNNASRFAKLTGHRLVVLRKLASSFAIRQLLGSGGLKVLCSTSGAGGGGRIKGDGGDTSNQLFGTCSGGVEALHKILSVFIVSRFVVFEHTYKTRRGGDANSSPPPSSSASSSKKNGLRTTTLSSFLLDIQAQSLGRDRSSKATKRHRKSHSVMATSGHCNVFSQEPARCVQNRMVACKIEW